MFTTELTIMNWGGIPEGKAYVHGKVIDPLNPDPGDIFIEDIAATLSKICRFNGQCPMFYSVAKHSLIVAALTHKNDLWDALAGLLHDASEYLIVDVPRPIKNRVYFGESTVCNSVGGVQYSEVQYKAYKEVEQHVTTQILKGLDLLYLTENKLIWDNVKHFDGLTLLWEIKSFFKSTDKVEEIPEYLKEFLTTEHTIREIEELFIYAYRELREKEIHPSMIIQNYLYN